MRLDLVTLYINVNISLLWRQKNDIVYPLPPPPPWLIFFWCLHMKERILRLFCFCIYIAHIYLSLSWMKSALGDWRFYHLAHCQDLVFKSSVCPCPSTLNVRQKAFSSLWSYFSFMPLQVKCWLSDPKLFLSAVLDVYVLSTDGQVQDFKFPQSSKGGISIQLSANTVKLNSRNGEFYFRKEKDCY